MSAKPDSLAVPSVDTESRTLRFLLRLGDRLRSLTDPVEVALQAAEMLGQHLQVARAGYGEIDQANGVFSGSWDWTNDTVASLAGEALKLDALGPALYAELRAGRTLVVEDCLTDPRVGEEFAAAWANIGARSAIVVPLVKAGQLTATFYLDEPQPRRWSEDEIALARDVADRTWDAVERARAEAALRESEARFRNLFDHAPVMVWVTAPDGTCTYLSRSWYGFTGQTPETGLGFGWLAAVHPDDCAEAERILLKAHAKREAFRLDYRLRRADGEYRWAIDAAAPRFDGNGTFLGHVGSVLDITDRKSTEDALRKSEARLQAVLRQLPVGVMIAEAPSGKLTLGNEQLASIWRGALLPLKRIEEWRAYHGFNRSTGEELEPHEWPIARALLDGEIVVNEEIDIRRNDGSMGTIQVSAVPLHNDEAQIIAAVAVVNDITERKRWEDHQQLLINELNHRVRNTLATVQSIAVQSFRTISEANHPQLQAFQERLMALACAHNVLTRENWESAELREIIAEVIQPYLRQAGERFEIEGPDLRLPPGMALALAMAIHELATNAAKYGALSVSSGRVSINWSRTENDPPLLILRWEEQGGPPVVTPTHRGFGTRLIERLLASELPGEAKLIFEPSGVVCVVKAVLKS